MGHQTQVVNSIKAHKEVQKSHCYSFIKPKRFRKVVQEFAGDGVLVLEGEEHRAHRRMLANPLSIPNIKKLQPIFEAKSRELCKLLDHSAGSTGIVDCTEVFTKVTLDIIGATILGLELENLSSTTFAAKAGEHPAESSQYSFYDAYEIIFEQNMLGKVLLFANSFFPVRWIPIKENRDWAFCTDWVKRVLQRTIGDRKAEVKSRIAPGVADSSPKKSNDLLTFIVEESMPGCPAEGLSEKNLLGHVSSQPCILGLCPYV